MKVKDLINQLTKFDSEAEVILQKDAEGNGYEECCGVAECIHIKNGYESEVYDLDWSADDCCMDDEEWEEMRKTTPKCIVLYP